MMESRGFYASEVEVKNLVDKFDKNKNGRISYAEFREEILPKSPVRHWIIYRLYTQVLLQHLIIIFIRAISTTELIFFQSLGS